MTEQIAQPLLNLFGRRKQGRMLIKISQQKLLKLF